MLIKRDCRYFSGAKPCGFNKQEGQECPECSFYSQKTERILIIKLDAIGDVLRTTCIIPKIREKYPQSYIVWITREEAADLLRTNSQIDEVWSYGVEALSKLQVLIWDYVYNCSNDYPSAALATLARAKQDKIGFLLSETGLLLPTNKMAEKWLQMASFDCLKKANCFSYQEIMYGICGFTQPIHPPKLSLPQALTNWAHNLMLRRMGGPTSIIGINSGAGSRWPKKMPDAKQLIPLLKKILNNFPTCQILLLGGPQEYDKNKFIATSIDYSRIHNIGCNYSLLEFSALISICNVLLCGDTLALHIASALGIPTVALFGPTSVAEIYPYNGLIAKVAVESLECLCCYSNCDKIDNCMTLLPDNIIIDSISAQLNYLNKLWGNLLI